MAGGDATAEAIQDFAVRADLLVVGLVREVAARAACTGVRVTIVTRGAVAAGQAQAGHSPLASTLWGLGRVLALEHAEHWGGLIDLDPARPAGEQEHLAAALTLSHADDEQALRAEGRLVARLVPAPPDAGQLRRDPPVRSDGTYLITGAFGGIGLSLAHWLARAGAGRLVLTGRSPLPPREEWDGDLPAPVRARVDAVAALERLGAEVTAVSCDVTDEAAMTSLFRTLDAGRWPLRGVIHAAGVSGPQFVRDVVPEDYLTVWRPKVIGGWLAHRLSANAPLDFFVGFSSIAATWGSQHLASYAAANAFLSALASQRAAAGRPGLAVEWGPWATDSSLFGREVMDFLKSTGLRPLAGPQCLGLLGALLHGDDPHPVVCAADWAVYKPVMEARTERPLFADIAAEEATAAEAGEQSDVLARVQGADPTGRQEILRDFLREACAEVLGADAAGLEPDDDLMSCGLDSLMVMDVVRRCKRALRVSVKASKLFERTTLADWADLLATELGQDSAAEDPAPQSAGPAATETTGPATGAAGGTSTAGPSSAPLSSASPGPEPTPADPADPAWIASDVTLDPAIRPAGPARIVTKPRDVLLTGATGFVGAYLLAELLASSGATVHCLVRCGSDADGLRRIRENFAKYLPWPDEAAGRVRIVRGDLAQPRLGLGEAEFAALADRLDTIIHNGAWVNFSYTYAQLRPANVTGTAEILRLACAAAPIPVHHVSTYGIWGLPANGRTVISEEDDIAGAGRLVTGYVQTKWAAERLAALARDRGIGVNVYRPGRVLGDSRTGACLTTHFTTRVIKGCVELGLAPDISLDIEMTPVDYVARGIVAIALGGRPAGATYHLVNGAKMRFGELVATLRERGWPVETIPVRRWWDRLRADYGERPNELHPVMDVVEEFVVGGEEAVHYAADSTEQALTGTGISCPPLDRRLLGLYLDWMTASGYLPAPGARRDQPVTPDPVIR